LNIQEDRRISFSIAPFLVCQHDLCHTEFSTGLTRFSCTEQGVS